MKAILVATGTGASGPAVCEPCELVHMFDRPFIQHVVEYLVQLGVDELGVVVSKRAARFEELLGAGERWGIQIRHVLAKDPDRPFAAIRAHPACEGDDAVLIGLASRLPQLQGLDSPAMAGAPPVFYHEASADPGEVWSGWAMLHGCTLRRIPEDLVYLELRDRWAEAVGGTMQDVRVESCLDVSSGKAMVESVGKVLRKQFQGLLLSGSEVEPGVWLSRNVSMRPTVEVRPPVYIGENCRIDRKTSVGPLAVVSANCILAPDCSVEDSVILPDSYVGEQLELSEVVVDRNRLINVRMGTAVTVTDDFILASLTGNRGMDSLLAVVRRVVGAILLVGLLPVLALAWLVLKIKRRGGRVVHRRDVRWLVRVLLGWVKR